MTSTSQPRPLDGPTHGGQDIICADDVSFRYADGTEALSHVHLHVREGSTMAIIGPNGAGKTTLLKILLGLLKGYSGTVVVGGQDPVKARQRGGVVSWVPQRARMIWGFPVTVAHVVKMGLVGKTGMFRRHRTDDIDYVRQLMDLMGIADIARKPIGEVSGGQQQRAIIARALAPRPAVLMLDEPTVGVDQAGQEAFATMMRQIKQQFNVTLVIVSHDLRAAIMQCQYVACLNRRMHFHDSPSRLTPQLLSEVFRCDLTGLFPTRPEGGHVHVAGNGHHDGCCGHDAGGQS